MPTIIDSLIVLLRLDPQGQFRKDQERVSSDSKKAKEQVVRDTKEAEASAKRVAEGINKVRREVIGMLTVFTAGMGIRQFIENTVTADAQTGRLAKQINTATDELSAWQGVLRRNGGASQDAVNGLGAITKAYQDIQLTGQSSLIPYLQNLGISLKDLENPSETLLKIADRFSNMPAPRAAALGAGFGFSPEMISLLSKGRGEVSRLLEEQQRLGVTTERDAQAAQRLQDVFNGLADASARLGRNLLTSLAPVLETITRGLQGLAKWAETNGPLATTIVVGLTAAVAALGTGLSPVILGVTALAAAVAVLVADYQKFAAGGPSTFDWTGVAAMVKALSATFEDLKAALGDVASAFGELIAAVPEWFWEGLRRSLVAIITLLATGLKMSLDGVVASARLMADVLRVIAALLRGDFSEAWRQAGKVGSDVIDGWRARLGSLRTGLSTAWDTLRGRNQRERESQPQPAAPAPARATNAAAAIRGYEGFRSNAYWDRNAWRVGYGSDTITDPRTGQVSKVTQRTVGVTREQAEADLQRRLRTEFTPRAASQVGDRWNSLPQATKDALTSVAYNYGSLPKSVVAAAKTGDNERIADSVAALQTHNDGINRERRLSEAASIRAAGQVQVAAAGTQAAAAARPVAQNDNRATTVNVNGPITVNTQARDAQGVARDLGPALKQHAFVSQANSGLSG